MHRRASWIFLLCAGFIALAGLLSGGTGQSPAGPKIGEAPRRIVPARVERLGAPDGKGAAEGPATFRLTLDRPREVVALGAHGGADGRLTLSALSAGEMVPAGELEIDGSIAAGWLRVALPTPQTAAVWLVEWRPYTATAAMPELELWGQMRFSDSTAPSADSQAVAGKDGAIEALDWTTPLGSFRLPRVGRTDERR